MSHSHLLINGQCEHHVLKGTQSCWSDAHPAQPINLLMITYWSDTTKKITFFPAKAPTIYDNADKFAVRSRWAVKFEKKERSTDSADPNRRLDLDQE